MRECEIKIKERRPDTELVKLSKEEKKELRKQKTYLAKISDIAVKIDTLLKSYPSPLIITTKEEFNNYIDKALENKEISIDTETTGLDVYVDEMVGICMYTPGSSVPAYVPIGHRDYSTNELLPGQLKMEDIKEYLIKINDIEVNMFNANFDIRVLRKAGADIHCTWDGYLMARLLNENEPCSLKPLYEKYILRDKGKVSSFNKLFELSRDISFAHIPPKLAGVYAANDAKMTQELKDFQKRVAEGTPRLVDIYKAFKEREMPCVDAVVSMEDTGFVFNWEWHKIIYEKYHKLLEEEKANCMAEIEKYRDAIDKWRKTPEANKRTVKMKDGKPVLDKYGNALYNKSLNEKLKEDINLSSATQISIFLYDVLKLKPVDPGNPRSTGIDALKGLDTDFTRALIKYRHFNKLVTSFVDSLVTKVGDDGIIHFNFNQMGAVTGRFSSSNPNIQQIPAGNSDIRKLFMAGTRIREASTELYNYEKVCINNEWVPVPKIKVGDILEGHTVKDVIRNKYTTNIIL